jgi:hypothetical protein
MAHQPFSPHFSARIKIHELESGGPSIGFFGFPESGVRRVPMGMSGVDGYQTVSLLYRADAEVPNGSSFDAECRLLYEGAFPDLIVPGATFVLWDGGDFATGVITAVPPADQ